MQQLQGAERTARKQEWATAKGDWETWVEENLVGGASAIHKWLGREFVEPKKVRNEEGALTTHPAELLNHRVRKWQGI